MKFFTITMVFAIGLLVLVQLSEAIQYWPFNPYFERQGKKRSPSQGECIRSGKVAQRRCSNGMYDLPLDALACYNSCRCDGGVFKCTHYADCVASEVTQWCRCPDGKDENDNCLGFMELCYCTPPNGLPSTPERKLAKSRRRSAFGASGSASEDSTRGPATMGRAELNAWDLGLDDNGKALAETH